MFGPTSPIQTGPYDRLNTVVQLDIPCSPCFSRTCSHQSCLRQLTIEPVLKLAAEAVREVRMVSTEIFRRVVDHPEAIGLIQFLGLHTSATNGNCRHTRSHP